jgi:hypothetical protein
MDMTGPAGHHQIDMTPVVERAAHDRDVPDPNRVFARHAQHAQHAHDRAVLPTRPLDTPVDRAVLHTRLPVA